jgi:hypothetical protein
MLPFGDFDANPMGRSSSDRACYERSWPALRVVAASRRNTDPRERGDADAIRRQNVGGRMRLPEKSRRPQKRRSALVAAGIPVSRHVASRLTRIRYRIRLTG